jgi:predicted acyltransferase
MTTAPVETRVSAVADAPLPSQAAVAPPGRGPRVQSIDALRGLVMFAMIFVNDIAGASGKIVPAWMRHYHGKDGMTFVDLVFPGFLFIVGMSIPFAIGPRLRRGEPMWKTAGHVVTRTLALLLIGILMVNGESIGNGQFGGRPELWWLLLFVGAIFAFCTLSPWRREGAAGGPVPGVAGGSGAGERVATEGLPEAGRGATPAGRMITRTRINLALRVLGFATLLFLALSYRSDKGRPMLTLYPFSLRTEWYGILGLIGWAYLVASLVFLTFRTHRTALLGSMAILLCCYAAGQTGVFDRFPPTAWLNSYVGVGAMLGSHGSIAVGGVLLATILLTADTASVWSRTRFTVLFVVGCALAALLLHGLYGINKNTATPSWCLWACAITGALWLVLYFVSDVLRLRWATWPLAVAGQNVLLAYLLHGLFNPLLDLLGANDWYSRLATPDLMHATARSAGIGVVILSVAAALNWAGFRLKL